jgi:hypothetical protein
VSARRTYATAVVISMLLAACGGSDDAGSAASTTARHAERSSLPSATSTPSAGPTSSAGATTSHTTRAVAGATTTPTGDTATPPRGGPTTLSPMQVDVTITPRCAVRGQPMHVTVRTRAHASIVAGAEYADGDPHGNFTIGDADANGEFRWSFPVSTGAPVGPAVVRVGVQDRTPAPDGGASTTGEEGSGSADFEVSRSC